MIDPVKDWLEEIGRQRLKLRLHGKYFGAEDIVLKHGVHFTGFAEAPRGTPRACFSNAFKYWLHHPGLHYCEGWAVGVTETMFPVHHAWCCDEERRIYDPTWDVTPLAHEWYYGVVFDDKFTAANAVRTERAGIFQGDHSWYDPLILAGDFTVHEFKKAA